MENHEEKKKEGAFDTTNIILAVVNAIAILWYSPAEIAEILGYLVGATIAITIIFKAFRWMKITKSIENSDRTSLTIALSIYLFIWASTHNFFGLL